jgi:hypothetical protein
VPNETSARMSPADVATAAGEESREAARVVVDEGQPVAGTAAGQGPRVASRRRAATPH